MADQPQSAGNGALSIDQAVGLLGAETPPESEEPKQQQDSAGDSSTPEDTGEPSEAISGEKTEGEEPAELPAIEVPRSWDKESKAKFVLLPREMQEVVAARESERETALSKAQQEAAENRKRADAEVSSIGQYKAALDQLLPKAVETFRHRWENVDWVKVTEQLGADEATKLRYTFEQEAQELQRLKAAQQVAENLEFSQYVEREGERLKSVAPDLADLKEGPARRMAVGKYLVENGIAPEELKWVNAAKLKIGYYAMLYEQGKASLAASKSTAAPGKAVIRPTAAKPTAAPQKQAVASLRAKAFKSGRIDDMVALLNAEQE